MTKAPSALNFPHVGDPLMFSSGLGKNTENSETVNCAGGRGLSSALGVMRTVIHTPENTLSGDLCNMGRSLEKSNFQDK